MTSVKFPPGCRAPAARRGRCRPLTSRAPSRPTSRRSRGSAQRGQAGAARRSHGDTVRPAARWSPSRAPWSSRTPAWAAGRHPGALKRVAGETINLMECTGAGRVYLAKDALDVMVVDLDGDTLTVEREHILAVTEPAPRRPVRRAPRDDQRPGPGDHEGDRPRPGGNHVPRAGDGLEVEPGPRLVVDPDAYVGRRPNADVAGVGRHLASHGRRGHRRAVLAALRRPASSTSSPRKETHGLRSGEQQGRPGPGEPAEPVLARRGAMLGY